MMGKLFTGAAIFLMTVLISCAGSNDKEYIDKSIIPAGSAQQTTNQPTAPGVAGDNIAQPQTITVPDANQVINTQSTPLNVTPQSPVVTTTVPPSTGGGKLNPAHGQPGHRCDISVGAPLDSKPAPATAQPAIVNTTQQPAVTMTQVPTQTKTAPGMNPPHGEPGHRCDISVGAPLDSKPAATTINTTPAQTATPPPLLTPVKKDSSKN